ncbi:50S ribosomal protein L15 [Buchnera aphidicola (Ceratoglyphina bambusae)]|uniref:50S ribosomal protein L15 n=1 Tax=Buchnera aphidicola TaxID=9 RepID=UPI0031B89456
MLLKVILKSNRFFKKKKRVGRGIGSGLGKTSGRGHKGQKSRKGCSIKIGFEGGQTPLYKRSPKFGFISRKKILTKELKFCKIINLIKCHTFINLNLLKSNSIVNKNIKHIKIIGFGEINKSIIFEGINLTKKLSYIVEKAGGKINR